MEKTIVHYYIQDYGTSFQYIRAYTNGKYYYGIVWDTRNGIFQSLTPEKRMEFIKSKVNEN